MIARTLVDQLIHSLIQARLMALHAAKLLADAQFYALEDLCADFIELKAAADGVVTREMAKMAASGNGLLRLAALSASIAADASFARQAIRKFCA
jgi:hypothetical protein